LDDEAKLDEIDARVRHIESWLSEHEGRSDSFWESQKDFNKLVGLNEGELRVRLSRIERRIVWQWGFATAVGSMSGGLATMFMFYMSG